MAFLRLVTYGGDWLDNANHPCTEETQNAVAKQLLHDNPDACLCYYFGDNARNMYDYYISRIEVREEMPNDERYRKWRENY